MRKMRARSEVNKVKKVKKSFLCSLAVVKKRFFMAQCFGEVMEI